MSSPVPDMHAATESRGPPNTSACSSSGHACQPGVPCIAAVSSPHSPSFNVNLRGDIDKQMEAAEAAAVKEGRLEPKDTPSSAAPPKHTWWWRLAHVRGDASMLLPYGMPCGVGCSDQPEGQAVAQPSTASQALHWMHCMCWQHTLLGHCTIWRWQGQCSCALPSCM